MNASLMLAAKHIYDASDRMREAMAMNTTGTANSGPAVNIIDKAYAAVGEKGGEVARISASLTRSGARNILQAKLKHVVGPDAGRRGDTERKCRIADPRHRGSHSE